MWFRHQPNEQIIRRFLEKQEQLPLNYPAVGGTRVGAPAGYDLDHSRIRLGRGQEVFAAAWYALRHWRMFPSAWTAIVPAAAPIREGQVVAIAAQACGVWWINACRIVYVLDEVSPIRRFGFAYGTLPGHVERGEERFTVEWLADDTVWYELRAFSRPRHWLVRLGYPLARRLQRRFVRDSQQAMREALVPRAGVAVPDGRQSAPGWRQSTEPWAAGSRGVDQYS